jgi:uncharacterized caspase-like protein
LVRVLHIGLIAALLAWAAPAVSQTMREHGLGGRGFTAPGSIRKAGRADARALVQRSIGVIGIPMFKITEPPHGVLVAYSTAAGQYAQDGTGNLSPYAQALLQALREPGIEMPKVFRMVSANVAAASNGSQVPSVLGNWPPEDLDVSRR